MAPPSHFEAQARAETLVGRLRARLGKHALWDFLLIFVPAVLALLCAVFSMNRAAWVSLSAAMVIAFIFIALSVLAVAWRYRRALATPASAAPIGLARSSASWMRASPRAWRPRPQS